MMFTSPQERRQTRPRNLLDNSQFSSCLTYSSINTKDLTKDSYPKEGNELSTYWAPQPDEYYTAAYFYQYRWFQTALIAGLGAEFQINRKFSVFAQLSYNHALNNTFTRDIEELTKGNLHTNFIGIEIGAML